MRKIATLMAFLTLTAGVLAEEITVRYVRPSTLITYFSEFQKTDASPFYGKTLALKQNPDVVLGRLEGAELGLVPKGVTLIAHDSKGVLEINGPVEDVAKVKWFVSTFDVEPKRVSVELNTSCKTLNSESQTKTTLVNNRKWSTEDELLRLGLTLAMRVNSDSTITMFVEITRAKSTKQTMTFRIKQGETIKFYVKDTVAVVTGDGKPTKIETDGKSSGDIDEPEVVLTLRANILDKLARVP